jgi:hypothetical protein
MKRSYFFLCLKIHCFVYCLINEKIDLYNTLKRKQKN